MKKINFIKMHGLGNDFIVIDNRINNAKITKNLIKALSDRKSGVGCDQLITIETGNKNNIDACIKIYNPSGDRAEACGNGTRCVAKLLFNEFQKTELQILSDAGIFGKNINGVDLKNIGPIIETNNLFLYKTNVEIVEIINKKKIKMRVWERGVGLTLACGSGACASVYAGQIKNLLDNDVEVQLERGSLFININNSEATMTGPAEISFHGSIEI